MEKGLIQGVRDYFCNTEFVLTTVVRIKRIGSEVPPGYWQASVRGLPGIK